ncbi:endonuclease/exonuclease/phosphatase family protein [archaeon]|jgi:endonuclease/exonuclease/phosphatase family metal-dependent hydrolase|nr:endonuclease/exonuclease/phosphatase family protein [archaeon]MBT3450322.1 endonuclease/exonuclease/phosphatase family protein [archaeon]MBT6869188.1 endonuclease/exonuclease/phosphatase family protein [archaeon]MBT7193724.1 endonuclease/exonuclease/phosphatase family protein [archaeon]MBT7381371.1 endonuclease/exonuclease/phosphatase family protein [archaeon]
MKIITYNTWQLPFTRDKKLRLIKLVSFLKEQDFDIINLQELWLVKDRNYVMKNFSHYYAIHSFTGPVINKSGLLTLIKKKKGRKIVSQGINYFPFTKYHTLKEKIGKKGYLKIIFSNNNKQINLVNTHTFDISLPGSKLVNESNVSLIEKPILKENKVILSGDFNLCFKDMYKITKFPFVCKEKTYEHDELYVSEKIDDKLDYIFYKGFRKGKHAIIHYGFSDHLGIVCELK